MDKSISVEVAKVCREFRVDNLKLSLTEFSELTNLNLKNVNAFEFGRANSIHYLMAYYKVCDMYQFEILSNRIKDIL